MKSKTASVVVATIGCVTAVGILAVARGSDYFGWALLGAIVIVIVLAAICGSAVVAERQDPAPAPERIPTPEALDEAVRILVERLSAAADHVDAIRTDDLEGSLRDLIERLRIAERNLGKLRIKTSDPAAIEAERNRVIMQILSRIGGGSASISVDQADRLIRTVRREQAEQPQSEQPQSEEVG